MTSSRHTTLFLWAVVLCGALICGWSVFHLSTSQLDLRFVFLALITLCLGSRLSIEIPKAKAHISISDTFIFLTMLLYGGNVAILLAAAESLSSSVQLSRGEMQMKKLTIIVNSSVCACATFITVTVLQLCFGPVQNLVLANNEPRFFSALCLIGLVQYLASSAIAAFLTSCKRNQSLWYTWTNHFLWTSITFFAGAAAVGVILRLVGQFGFYAIVVTTPIIAIVFFTYQRYVNDIKTAGAQAEQAERARAEQAESHVAELSLHIAEQERTSNALEESEARFRNAFDHAAIGMALVSPTGRWLRVNRILCEILGYSEEELLETNLQSVTHPDDLANTLVNVYRLLEGEISTYQTEKRYIHKKGSHVWVQLSLSLVRDSDHQPVHLITQVQDITESKKAHAALRERDLEYRNLFENTPIGIYRATPAGRILMANQTLITMLGYSTLDQLTAIDIEHKGPDSAHRSSRFKQVIEGKDAVKGLETSWRKRDGSPLFVRENAKPIRSPDGAIQYYEGTVEDITERKDAEEATRQAEKKYRGIFENAVEGIFQSTPDGKFIAANPALARMLGYDSAEDLLKARTNIQQQHYVEPGRRLEFKRLLAEYGVVQKFENEVYRKDGTKIWTLENVRAVRNTVGEVLYYEGTIEDTTERKRADEQLYYTAFHDGLTGLPNRALLTERLKEAMKRPRRGKSDLFAVLFLDLDRFKNINVSLGHSVGDELLIAIARRLQNSIRESDTVARLGGDEFAILLDGISGTGDAVNMAERIQNELSAPFSLNGHEVFTTGSIGIAIKSANHDGPENLLREADTAMYRAKAGGKARYEMFDKSMHARAVALLSLENDLRRAIERNEFRVHYQPIVSLANQEIVGFEALVRWAHPVRGLVSPVEFIPVAEETGLISKIGRWVLRESCRQTREWQLAGKGRARLTISVNLSSRQLMQPHLVEEVSGILIETGLKPEFLKLEITESAVMENAEKARKTLGRLRDLGLFLSIDDFGTGYSSLSYLHRFPVNTLKIDRSFISRMGPRDEDYEIVRTILTLANNLGMDVVAEGVETVEQLEQLKSLKCKYGQGYLFSKPLDAGAAEEILENFSRELKPIQDTVDILVTPIDLSSHVN